MGGAFRKEIPDPRTGLTERERAAILQTWKRFLDAHKDYGELIFLAMFTRHPDYIELFRQFRGKTAAELPGEAQFRAHACAVGYQLSSMVDSVHDSVLLEALIRKNAISHLERPGVHPFHFQGWPDSFRLETAKLPTKAPARFWLLALVENLNTRSEFKIAFRKTFVGETNTAERWKQMLE
ncbi:hypothetical protein HPB49_013316 [Dermacentor silvarum]|uniref:Uncharacterized protein n=1 Tax=Dermacentor silvarum TaxID=543639 RepID=A0ACB8D5P8_DERSI|nr:hypothetical protein HPB49_013316 [Dermacentor silvarum]